MNWLKNLFKKKIVYVPIEPPVADQVLYFSGRTKEYNLTDNLDKVVEGWNWIQEEGKTLVQCGECTLSVLNKALHLVTHHEYTTEGELRNVSA